MAANKGNPLASCSPVRGISELAGTVAYITRQYLRGMAKNDDGTSKKARPYERAAPKPEEEKVKISSPDRASADRAAQPVVHLSM